MTPASSLMRPPLRLVSRVVADPGLLRSTAIVFLGDASARMLGFLFSVAAARILTPAGYGQIAYALAAVGIVTVLTNNAPSGMGRFLARHQSEPHKQKVYATNWLTIISLMLASSLVLVIPVGIWAGLGGAMLIALMANLLGTAVFQTYREAQKGLGRFWITGGYYVFANLIQLGAIILLGTLGWRSPALFLIVYGLAPIAALAVIYPLAPAALDFSRALVVWRQARAIARYTWPIILQGIFYNVWYGADLILIHRLLHHPAIGNYAAAKTFNMMLLTVMAAFNYALGPRMVRLADSALRGYIINVSALSLALILPIAGGLALFGRPLIGLIFGSQYELAADVFLVMVCGQAIFAYCGVLQAIWGWGLSRPAIDSISSGTAMVVTLATGLVLIPHLGLIGAAWAYGAGATAQLAVLVSFTVSRIYVGAKPRLTAVRDLILELESAASA